MVTFPVGWGKIMQICSYSSMVKDFVKGSVKVILLGGEDGLERWTSAMMVGGQPVVSLGMDLRFSLF